MILDLLKYSLYKHYIRNNDDDNVQSVLLLLLFLLQPVLEDILPYK